MLEDVAILVKQSRANLSWTFGVRIDLFLWWHRDVWREDLMVVEWRRT